MDGRNCATVTVGIPFFNASATLLASIRSVLAQSFQDWELLLVDDGSTDRSLQIAQSVDDPRVHVISDGVNRGLVHRLNQMVNEAGGTYFARMDADDMMHPQRLAAQVALLTQQPEIDIVGTAAYVIDQCDWPYGIRGDGPDSILQSSVRTGFLHPTVMGKTDWFRRNPYDQAFPRAEDTELWMRVDVKTKCLRLREPLLFYREPLTFNSAKYGQSMRSVRKAIRKHSKNLLEGTMALARNFAGEALIRTLAMVNLESFMIRRRNRTCTDLEVIQALGTMGALEQVAVPGAVHYHSNMEIRNPWMEEFS